MLTRVAPPSDTIWIESRCPEPIETVIVDDARPPLADAEVALIVRDAQPLPDAESDALKLRPAMSCSIERAAFSSGPHSWKVPWGTPAADAAGTGAGGWVMASGSAGHGVPCKKAALSEPVVVVSFTALSIEDVEGDGSVVCCRRRSAMEAT